MKLLRHFTYFFFPFSIIWLYRDDVYRDIFLPSFPIILLWFDYDKFEIYSYQQFEELSKISRERKKLIIKLLRLFWIWKLLLLTWPMVGLKKGLIWIRFKKPGASIWGILAVENRPHCRLIISLNAKERKADKGPPNTGPSQQPASLHRVSNRIFKPQVKSPWETPKKHDWNMRYGKWDKWRQCFFSYPDKLLWMPHCCLNSWVKLNEHNLNLK